MGEEEGGGAKERVESVGRMTLHGSLARAGRSNGLWHPRGGGMLGWGRGQSLLADIGWVIVVLNLDRAKGKVDWNPLNV